MITAYNYEGNRSRNKFPEPHATDSTREAMNGSIQQHIASETKSNDRNDEKSEVKCSFISKLMSNTAHFAAQLLSFHYEHGIKEMRGL